MDVITGLRRFPGSYQSTENAIKEIDRLRAELASRQIDIDTFREGNQNLRAELANARLERDNIAALNSSLIAKDRIIANLDERSAQYERDSVAKDARIAELEAYHTNCTDYINGLLGNMADDDKERVAILARAERAEARVAELETDHLFAENKRLREACQEFRARAERAEAERDAMRKALEPFARIAETLELMRDTDTMVGWRGLRVIDFRKARAALAPSPAGGEK